MCSSGTHMLDSGDWAENCLGISRTPTAAMPKSSTYGTRENDMLGIKQENHTQKMCDLGGAADQDVCKPESRPSSLVSAVQTSQTAASCHPMTVTVISSKHPARPVYTRSCWQLHRLQGADLGSTMRIQGYPLLASPQVHDIQMKFEGPHLGDLPQDLASRLQSFFLAAVGMPPLHVSVGQGCVHLVALLLDISAGMGIAGLAAHRRRRRFHGGCGASDVTSLPARLMSFMRGVLPDSAAPVRVTVRQGGRVYDIQAGTAAAEPPQQLNPQVRGVGTCAGGDAAIPTAATVTRSEQHAAWSLERLQLPSVSSVKTSALAPSSMDLPPKIAPLVPRTATVPTPSERQVAIPTWRGGSTWGSSKPNPDSSPSQALDGTLGQRTLAASEFLEAINEAFMHHQPTTAATRPANEAFLPEGCGSIAGGSVGPSGITRLSCSTDAGPMLGATAVVRHHVSGAHLGRLPPTDAGTLHGCNSSVSFGCKASESVGTVNARLSPIASASQLAVGHWWLSPPAPSQACYSAGSNVSSYIQPTSNYESSAAEGELSYRKQVLEHTASKGRALTNRLGIPPSPLGISRQPQQPEAAAGAAATAVARGRNLDGKSSHQVADIMASRQQSLAPLLQLESPARQVLSSEQISAEGQSRVGRVRSTYRKWTQPGEGGGAAAAATANLPDIFPSASSGQYGTSPEGTNATNPDGLRLSLNTLHKRSFSGDRSDGCSFPMHTAATGAPEGNLAPMAAKRPPSGMASPLSHGAAGYLAPGNVPRGAPSAVRVSHLAPSDASVWPPPYPPAVRASVVSTALGLSGSGISAATALVTASANANSTTSTRSLLGAGMEQLEAMSRRLMLPMPVSLARMHAHPVTQPVELLCPPVLNWPAATHANADPEPSNWPTDWDILALPAKRQLGSSVRLLMRCPDVIARPSYNPDGMSADFAGTFHRDTGSVFGCRASQAATPPGRGTSVGDSLSAANLHMANRTASTGGGGRDSDVDSELACSGHVSQLIAWNRSGAVTVMQVDDSAEGCTRATLLLVPDSSLPARTGRAPDVPAGKAPEQGSQVLGTRGAVAAGGGETSSSPTFNLSAGAAPPAGLAHLVYVAWRRGQSLGPPCPVLLLSEGLEDVVDELQGLQPPPLAAAEGLVRNSHIGPRTSSPPVQLPQQQPDPHSHQPLQQTQSVPQTTRQVALVAYHNFLSDLGVWLEGLQLATSSTGSATTATSCLHRSNLSVHGTPSGIRTGSTSGVRTPYGLGIHGESSALVALLTAGGAISYGSAPSVSGVVQLGGNGDDRPAATSAISGADRVIAMPASAAFRTYVDRFAATPSPVESALPPVSPRVDAICADVSPVRPVLITSSGSSPTVPLAPPAASAGATQPASANDFESDERVARLAEEILGVGCDLLGHAIASGTVATAQLILKMLLAHGPRLTRLKALAAAIEGNPFVLFGGSTTDADADISAAAMAVTRSAILRLIIETCRAANAAGQTLLHLAVMSGSLRMLHVMLEVWPHELGLDVQVLNRRDRFGRTPADIIGGGAVMAATGTGTARDEDSGRGAAAAERFAAGAALLLDALGAPLEEDPVSNAAVVAAIAAEPALRWGLDVVQEGSSEGRALAALVSMHVQRVACPTSGATEQVCDSGSLVGSNGAELSWVQQRNSRPGGSSDRGIDFYGGGRIGDDADGQGHSGSGSSSHAARLACLHRRRGMELSAAGAPSVQSGGGLRGAGALLWHQPEQSALVEGAMALRQQGQLWSAARAGSQGRMPARVRRPLWGALVVLLGAVQALMVLLFAMPRARALPPSASLLSPPGLLLWLPCACLVASSGLSAATGLLLHPRQLAKKHWLPSVITVLGRTAASTMVLAVAEQLPLGHELTAMAVNRTAAVEASIARGPVVGLFTLVTAAGSGRSDLVGIEAGVRMLMLTLAPAVLEADLPSARAALLSMEHVLPLIYVTMYGSIDVCLIWMLYAVVNVACGVVLAAALEVR